MEGNRKRKMQCRTGKIKEKVKETGGKGLIRIADGKKGKENEGTEVCEYQQREKPWRRTGKEKIKEKVKGECRKRLNKNNRRKKEKENERKKVREYLLRERNLGRKQEEENATPGRKNEGKCKKENIGKGLMGTADGHSLPSLLPPTHPKSKAYNQRILPLQKYGSETCRLTKY